MALQPIYAVMHGHIQIQPLKLLVCRWLRLALAIPHHLVHVRRQAVEHTQQLGVPLHLKLYVASWIGNGARLKLKGTNKYVDISRYRL